MQCMVWGLYLISHVVNEEIKFFRTANDSSTWAQKIACLPIVGTHLEAVKL
jgi:hypothetical protein